MTNEERQMYQAIADTFWLIAVIGTAFIAIGVIAFIPLIWNDLRAIFKRS